MSGDTRHPWSYPGCIGRDVNRGTWVDLLSSNRGSNVRNVIWNQGVGSNSHGDLLLLAGTVGEALFNRSAFGTPALRLGWRATYGCLPTKTMLQKGAGPKVPPDTKLIPPPSLPPLCGNTSCIQPTPHLTLKTTPKPDPQMCMSTERIYRGMGSGGLGRAPVKKTNQPIS